MLLLLVDGYTILHYNEMTYTKWAIITLKNFLKIYFKTIKKYKKAHGHILDIAIDPTLDYRGVKAKCKQ